MRARKLMRIGELMQEIGGYFELDTRGEIWHRDAFALNSGRNCLRYMIQMNHIKEIWIPYYICNSVIDACRKEKCIVKYYNITAGFLPDLDRVEKQDWLYIVNYFGQLRHSTLKKIQKQYPNVIIDNSQAFFCKPLSGAAAIYNCRKFFGVADGAYLYIDKGSDFLLERDLSMTRMGHVLGRTEHAASRYFQTYQENEKRIENLPILKMSKLTESIMGNLDYKKNRLKRTQNAKKLHHILRKKNLNQVRIPKGMFMYPMVCEDGEKVRQKLILDKIYVPKLWNEVEEKKGFLNIFEIELCKNLVCLPCDQRYTMQEIEFIANKVLETITN